jgi:hypothetical protein
MIDLVLISTVLDAIIRAERPGEGLTEEVIGVLVETILRKPIVAHQLRAALVECKNRKFAEEKTDTWNQQLWYITDTGRAFRNARMP